MIYVIAAMHRIRPREIRQGPNAQTSTSRRLRRTSPGTRLIKGLFNDWPRSTVAYQRRIECGAVVDRECPAAPCWKWRLRGGEGRGRIAGALRAVAANRNEWHVKV